MKALASVMDDLESMVGRFDEENWREGVPDVKTDTENLRDAFEELRKVLGISD